MEDGSNIWLYEEVENQAQAKFISLKREADELYRTNEEGDDGQSTSEQSGLFDVDLFFTDF